MKRTHTNFLIDAAAFVEFALLLSTGLLVRYVLPPGSGHSATLWGLGRHDWGGVHFWIAVAFLATLSVHLVLHWKWIVCVVKGQRSEASGTRLALGALALVLTVALAAAPLAAPVQVVGQPIAERGHEQPARVEEQHSPEEQAIRGSMTLAEVETTTGVPADYLIQALRLPTGVQTNERLGPLKRQFGFEIQQVRDAVAAYAAP